MQVSTIFLTVVLASLLVPHMAWEQTRAYGASSFLAYLAPTKLLHVYFAQLYETVPSAAPGVYTQLVPS